MKIVIRNDEKKDKAVSAIIGTILIVAITVVLAATLYAVLGGFGGLIGKPTPTASMTVSITGTSNYSVTFTSVSSNLTLANTQLKISDANGTHVLSYSTTSNDYTGSGITVTVQGGGYLTFNTVIDIIDSHSINAIYIIDTQTGGVVASQTNI
ncbi:MAG: archaellin/type IV pilin N-terminal domain-containing protein [Thermoplasmataceae archaeon]|jgi:flagellin-like protein